jgi:DNA polymerase I-like protein with 3'-5' exonuclease and polymerase domains
VANIPKPEPEVVLGKECRSIFTVPEGRVMVGVDASGLELRMLANRVGTPAIIEMIVNGTKEAGTEIHTVLHKACAEWVQTRSTQKNVNYGWLYGASDKKLGATAGHSDATAAAVGAKIRASLVSAIPGLEDFMARVEEAARAGRIVGLDGRIIPLRSKHAALNTILQSDGSILVKWATCYMNAKIREKKLPAFQVIHYHDEVQLEASGHGPGSEAAEYFIEGLRWAGRRFGVVCPLDGNVSVGRNWAETH